MKLRVLCQNDITEIRKVIGIQLNDKMLVIGKLLEMGYSYNPFSDVYSKLEVTYDSDSITLVLEVI